jgi:hypothetical protein
MRNLAGERGVGAVDGSWPGRSWVSIEEQGGSVDDLDLDESPEVGGVGRPLAPRLERGWLDMMEHYRG